MQPGKDFVTRSTLKKLENAREKRKYSSNRKSIVVQMGAQGGALKEKAGKAVSLVRLLIE